MSDCSKCKKKFEETELMWVKVKEKMVLLCDFCIKILEKEKVVPNNKYNDETPRPRIPPRRASWPNIQVEDRSDE